MNKLISHYASTLSHSTISITALSLATLATFSVFAMNDDDLQDYQLIALKDCEIVYQAKLTEEQQEAMRALDALETKMDSMELPTEEFEVKIELLSKQLEDVTKVMIVEDENSLFIDKTLIQKQEELADEIDQLVSAHEPHFRKIEIHSEKIEAAADTFSELIKADLKGLDYDSIHIRKDDDSGDTDKVHCAIHNMHVKS
ncbi:hypothetical protein KIH87_01085 [Paraneptunicella aestuarii]|uniref:hypothetical protein n=1 Tax=Paraneptunicella aestuarii TaxID=2831148 RepID=UPI001E4F28AF|nr:hypothetical protein [Paraneptunicella aestuarii]UAA38996.1 hypothetical protein KIH87_01085 [Paraneptunicella aestuarii]